MQNTVDRVHKSGLLFPFKTNKLDYNLYNRKTKLAYFTQPVRAGANSCSTDALSAASLLQSATKKKKKQKEPASLPTYMHIGNPLTQRHHLPVCTEQQQPLWILNLNGLIVPPTPICSKAASEPLSSKLWSLCRFFFLPKPIPDLPAP